MSAQVGRMRDRWTDARAYSWATMLHALEHGVATHWPSNQQNSMEAGTDTWRGGITWSDCRALCAGRGNVWPEGRREIETIAREQASKIIRARRPGLDYLMDTTGQWFDVPSVIEGRPECWARPIVSDRGDRLTIRLLVDVGVSANVPAEQVQTRMAAIAACVLTLQAQGTPVEVIAVLNHKTAESDPTPSSWGLAIHVNESGRPIDVARLVAMAHASFLRRAMFRLIELTPVAESAAANVSGYGTPGSLTDALATATWGKQSILIPTNVGHGGIVAAIQTIQTLIKARIGRKGSDDAEA